MTTRFELRKEIARISESIELKEQSIEKDIAKLHELYQVRAFKKALLEKIKTGARESEETR